MDKKKVVHYGFGGQNSTHNWWAVCYDYLMSSDRITTIRKRVTCKNCKRTKAYKEQA